MDQLAELRALLQSDPQRVAEGAARLVAAARSGGDPVALSRTLAVLGRARRALGDIALAEHDLTEAIALASQERDADLEADARIGLAGVFIFSGRSSEAYDHLDTVDRIGSPRLVVYAALQRAALSQHLGRSDDALAAYERVLPVLRAIDQPVDLALVIMNRSMILANRGEWQVALDGLTEAGSIFAEHDHRYGCAQVRHNRGLVHALSGDLPAASRDLDAAADAFRELGHPGLVVDVDRIDVLLALGLIREAAELASSTARRATADGDHAHAAQVWLLAARAALLDGDHAASAAYAASARASFEAQDAQRWSLLARVDELRAQPGSADPAEAADLGLALEGHAHRAGAATAYALAATAAARDADAAAAAAYAERAGVAATGVASLEVELLVAVARARAAGVAGELDTGRSIVASGLDALHRRRALVGATDARTALGLHARELVALGSSLAAAHDHPDRLFRFVEESRSAGAGVTPARDDGSRANLTELRAVVHQINAAEAAGEDTADLDARRAGLESAAQRAMLRADAARPASDAPTIVTPEQVAAALAVLHADARLVYLVDVDGRLEGLVARSGTEHVQRFGPTGVTRDVVAAAGALASAVRASLTGPAGAVLGRAAAALDRVLAPLVGRSGPVVLVLPDTLHAVPWALVPSLARRPVCIAPSATWWAAAVQPLDEVDRAAGRADAVLTVAGPRLAYAAAEAEAVAGCYGQATPLVGGSATVANVLAALRSARVAHVASHAAVRSDRPIWSALELCDGPLYVGDLVGAGRTPDFVVLSGCDTGVGVRAGDGLLGLASALLGAGTATLVAATCPLPDHPRTRDLMIALHSAVVRGSAPAAALATVVADLLDAEGHDAPGVAATAALGCFGTHGRGTITT